MVRDIIRQAMISEAVDQALDSKLTGDKLSEKIVNISSKMGLTEDETQEVVDTVTNPSNTDTLNTVWFETEDEMDEAIGLLMYRKIPWESKGESDDFFYVEFLDQETLQKAYSILKNKWSLVDYNQRTSALIQFDNITEYLKVLDFLKKEGMIVEFGNTDSPFMEDYNVQVSNTKTPKEATLENYQGSFVAKNNRNTFEHDPKPYSSSEDKIASVRKSWS